MSTTIQTFGIDELPVDEQLALVRDIWDHIAASGPSPRLSDGQHDRLDFEKNCTRTARRRHYRS